MKEIDPKKLQRAVELGFGRLKTYRNLRAMLVKEFVGQYYNVESGISGNEPLNLIFNAVRTLIPNIIMNSPRNKVETAYVKYMPYAKLLSLGIDTIQDKINIKRLLRAILVDTILGGTGIAKTGECASGNVMLVDTDEIDPGQIFTALVSLDNFVMDPYCTSIEEAYLLGDRVRMNRDLLLADDNCDHDIVEALPKAGRVPLDNKKTKNISQKTVSSMDDTGKLEDLVDVVQLWLPKSKTLVLVPDPYQLKSEKFISQVDYYGPDGGPYTFLSLAPPVPDNPVGISLAGIWYDLHCVANEMTKKMIKQATRQKDIILYKPSAADEVEDMRQEEDGGSVMSEDPSAVNSVSFGGQNQNNERMMAQVQVWFNMVAGNPDQLNGVANFGSATQSSINQGNLSVGIEDLRNLTYEATADISRKHAWYLHNDPLIELPIPYRKSDGDYVQLRLTPEERRGDFLDYIFKIVPKSMSYKDPTARTKTIVEFATNLMPALINSAMIATQAGIPFNLQKAVTDLAEELDISDKVESWFNDPEFQAKLALFLQKGPQGAGKAAAMMSPQAIAQNNGPATQTNVPTGTEQNNASAQQGANQMQGMLK